LAGSSYEYTRDMAGNNYGNAVSSGLNT